MAAKSFSNGSSTFSNPNIFPVFVFSDATNVTKNVEQFN